MDFSKEGIHCIYGPSGSGKTTLLNSLVGLTSYEKGEFVGFRENSFSYIFQEERLLPWATVEENIRFVLESLEDKDEINKRIDKYLSIVGLQKFKKSYPQELSGGMKQRVSIARAFAYEGDILIMDEPFKGLHIELKRSLMNYIIDYWKEKKGVFILVTHDIEEVLYMADYIHIFQGPPLTLTEEITIEIPQFERERNSNSIMKYRDILSRI